MNTLTTRCVAQTLNALHAEAEIADREHIAGRIAQIETAGETFAQAVPRWLTEERAGYQQIYRGYAGNFLAVSPAYGRFLYMIARTCWAKRIVEFGTSMGISTLYLAAALRDNGGGRIIGSEIEPSKAARARANLEEAGLADLVDIREGDALDTLRAVGGEVDLLLLDGAFSLYLPVLRQVEPFLTRGAVILGENAFDPTYLDYVRNPENGYLSQSLAIDDGRGNEFTVRTA
ncbi:O-methyltransferase [Gluconacetobacter sacchari]|uniref:Methyltransferase n=2 Tax=Gluconacetobacter sacchari TaxID=92759 RepID=A0A7W4NQ27_9PROT|nr:class I SAM-dependent methyltransferase [Gluconacetobacter sacchari]MBB2162149.1 methyltransferase [Gluconacetobacter sacchari]GBQ25398.1 putative O-methyltransferase [Gluconacetobacter sacchari DSM 12717]